MNSSLIHAFLSAVLGSTSPVMSEPIQGISLYVTEGSTGMLVSVGPSAQALYNDMNNARKEKIELESGATIMNLRYGLTGQLNCAESIEEMKAPEYVCVVSLSNVSTGELRSKARISE